MNNVANSGGFSAPIRNGKPMKDYGGQKKTNNDKRKKQTNRAGIVGTAQGINLTVSESDRKYRGTVFATRYRQGIALSEVKSNLERNLHTVTGVMHHVDVERLKPKVDTYSSFTITCVCNDTSVLMNPNIWPERSFVGRWIEPKQSRGGITGSRKSSH